MLGRDLEQLVQRPTTRATPTISHLLVGLTELISNGYTYVDQNGFILADANAEPPLIIRMKKSADVQSLQFTGYDRNRALLILRKNDIKF